MTLVDLTIIDGICIFTIAGVSFLILLFMAVYLEKRSYINGICTRCGGRLIYIDLQIVKAVDLMNVLIVETGFMLVTIVWINGMVRCFRR